MTKAVHGIAFPMSVLAGDFRVSERTLVNPAQGDQVCLADVRRWLLAVYSAGAVGGTITTLQATGVGKGLPIIGPNTAMVPMTFRDWGPLLWQEWRFDIAIAQTVSVWEVFYDPPPQ